jgi:hypothetical protein
MKYFELFLIDLLPEKRKEFLEAHGCWEVDENDPSTWPHSWDRFPIATFTTEEPTNE